MVQHKKTTNGLADKTSNKLSCSKISVSNGGQQKSNNLTNNTEHLTQNNPLGPGPSSVWENIFHLFFSSASGKYNLLKYYHY